MPQPRVLVVAGFPNSGTTIASYVLGQHRDIFVAGELAKFPTKQLKAGKLCSCGRPATACEFWTAVVRRLGESACHPAGVRLGSLYRAIAAESGASVILDVAHDLHAVAEVCNSEGVDVRLVHLRRPRQAVLNSRLRRLNSPGHELSPGLPPRLKRIFRHVMRLHAFDHAVDRLRRTLGEQRAMTVHYDTLCSQPQDALPPIGLISGLDLADIGARLASGAALTLPPHMIRGNPGLQAKQVVHLKRDDGYASELSTTDRLACTAISGLAPMLLALRSRIVHRGRQSPGALPSNEDS